MFSRTIFEVKGENRDIVKHAQKNSQTGWNHIKLKKGIKEGLPYIVSKYGIQVTLKKGTPPNKKEPKEINKFY